MTTEERAIHSRIGESDQWLTTTPEATSAEAWNLTAQHNPTRAAQLVKDFAKARQFRDATAKRLGELSEIRQSRSAQWHAAQNAARAKINEAEDDQLRFDPGIVRLRFALPASPPQRGIVVMPARIHGHDIGLALLGGGRTGGRPKDVFDITKGRG